jgi:hypothetical protein
MAGTADDHSTLDQSLEWLLITAARALVARYMPEDAAKEFLLIELSAKRIRYRYQGKAEFSSPLVFPLKYFFVRHKLIEHEIAADGAVIRKGPALVRGKRQRRRPLRVGWVRRGKVDEDTEKDFYIFDPKRRSVVVRLPLVQLHRDDILRRLQETGYLSTPAVESEPVKQQQEIVEPALCGKKAAPGAIITCESWVDDAVKKYPRKRMPPEWEGKGGYAAWLKTKAPKDWSKRTIGNRLADAGHTPKTAHKRTHKRTHKASTPSAD